MSEMLVTRFFDARWVQENEKDIARARELTRQARAELAAMSNAQLAAEFDWLLAEANDILVREN